MSARLDRFGLPIGPSLDGWTAPPPPTPAVMSGRTCRLEPFDAGTHVDDLFEAYAADDGRIFTYLPFGPHEDSARLAADIEALQSQRDAVTYAIVVDGRAVGMASYLRITPNSGSVEVGAICLAPELARTTAATEAMFLLADHAFALGYRRYEWKCDALNAASNAAARRLGFRYEGTFRNATVYKGRSRDTAWLSITDDEWPSVRSALVRWLDPGNFDSGGRQRATLQALREQ